MEHEGVECEELSDRIQQLYLEIENARERFALEEEQLHSTLHAFHRDTIKQTPPCYINRLPPELLSMIFINAIPDSFAYHEEQKEDVGFLYVCRSWRKIALDTPRLWCRFLIQEPDYDEDLFLALFNPIIRKPRAQRHRRMETWLSRVKNLPIEVIIRPFGPDWDAKWGLLFKEAYRWRKLSFEGDRDDLYPCFFHLQRTAALEVLSLSVNSQRNIYQLALANTACLPALRTVEFHHSMPTLGKLSGPSVRSLTLDMCDIPMSYFATIPLAFPLLASLTILKSSICDTDNMTPKELEGIDLNNLTEFQWCYSGNTTTTVDINFRLFRRSTSLTSLTVSGYKFQFTNAMTLPSLRELSLSSHISKSVDTFKEYFAYFPHLERLTLCSNCMLMDCTNVLTSLGPSLDMEVPPPCPQLKELVLREVEVDRDLLLSVLRARRSYWNKDTVISKPDCADTNEDGHSELRITLDQCYDTFYIRLANLAALESAFQNDPDLASECLIES